jgi:NAD(P)-dependent dehydrogenase (short-subunit alcohol dehydrogenase family)
MDKRNRLDVSGGDGGDGSFADLAGQHVLVTGGANGIGAAVVAGFVNQGARVTFLDKDAAAADALTKKLGARVAKANTTKAGMDADVDARFYETDLADLDRLERTLGTVRAERGPVNVLVNNAAFDPRCDFTRISNADWEDLFRLNVGHYFVACRAVLPDMIAARAGSIIMVSSTQVWLGEPALACYTATKAAIIGMVRSLASEVGRHGVRVNAIAPGWIMTERQLRDHATPEARRKLVDEKQILPVLLQPEDVVPAFLFLASSASRAMTRQTLVVDAGMTMT